MTYLKSINPYTLQEINRYPVLDNKALEKRLARAEKAFVAYRKVSLAQRAAQLRQLAELLRREAPEQAPLLTREMGKPLAEARAEIEKCAWLCDYYAEQGEAFLQEQEIKTDAHYSAVRYRPIGAVLAIMPWNFPFWQVFRFAVPALMLGNAGLLKHAPNVQGCAEAIEKLILKAGFPEGILQNLPITTGQVESVIADQRVQGVTLTGSEQAGKAVAQQAGAHLKKTVLELGGSNAMVILKDAHLDKAITLAVKARMMNNAQSCIAAKRFIVTGHRAAAFAERLKEKLEKLPMGDPMLENTAVGPLARVDLAEKLEQQVQQSLAAGAKLITGGRRQEAFYEPTILTEVKPGMPAFNEELFGPVAAVISAESEAEAMHLAAATKYGLGLSIITPDMERAQKLSTHVPDGAVFINELVKSDPRLPFGGTKNSGYGRELAREGLLEFANRQTYYLQKDLT